MATFLHERDPQLAQSIGQAIVAKVTLLEEYPLLGRPIEGRNEYRQLVLRVMQADYVFQYRFDDQRLVILRIFHGREKRS